ncbi:hypothetical protein SKAU_G00187360 [Synaphobranchus kaupii]|uniref:Uncharacterized protein n=1 Tax=Synaphobranchus kaupii TaxID=118154 RepID=A0A9Q1IUV2_SYNKA|nr:hypothetical protein SKAU_G00187360 [Synaphobranchus kaupii]
MNPLEQGTSREGYLEVSDLSRVINSALTDRPVPRAVPTRRVAERGLVTSLPVSERRTALSASGPGHCHQPHA